MSLTRWVRRAGARRRSALPSLLFGLLAVAALGGPAAAHVPGVERPPGARPDPGYVPHLMHMGPNLPEVSKASLRQQTAARRLLRGTRRLARRFGSVRAAGRGGYHAVGRWSSHGIRHFDSRRAETDGHGLDPRRPESLLFWRGPDGRRRLAAAMYRWPSDARPPRPAGPLMRWHLHYRCVRPSGSRREMPFHMCRHGRVARSGTSSMLHVWLTNDLATAYAMAPPLDALAAAYGLR